ncbi:MAG: zinc ribbon domain-containing protein [Anaerolineae bacterium]|nr:zinc ribbon domain-containing protein [Anaerolineae bacterium]
MPIYEYTCQSCHQQFEKLVRFGDSGQSPQCPHCQSQDTHKKLSLFATNAPASTGSISASSSSCGSGRFT